MTTVRTGLPASSTGQAVTGGLPSIPLPLFTPSSSCDEDVIEVSIFYYNKKYEEAKLHGKSTRVCVAFKKVMLYDDMRVICCISLCCFYKPGKVVLSILYRTMSDGF